MFFIYIVIMLAYLAIGARFARQDYAIRTNRNRNRGIDPVEQKIKIDAAKVQHLSIAHAGHCNMTYSSLAKKGCDCSNQRKWIESKSNLERLQAGLSEIPSPNYSIVPGWPLFLMTKYVRGENLKEESRRMAEIAEAEHQAQLAEIRERESAALDRELARVKGTEQ